MKNAAAELYAEASIMLQDDGNSVFLSISPDSSRVPVSVAWLMEQFYNSRYLHAKIDPIAITRWVKTYNASGDIDNKIIVAQLINAQCELKIDSEAMSAYLFITPAMGGTDISRRDIIASLIANRITSGIVNRSITEALQNPDASKLLIAKGKPPKHGQDSRFEVRLGDLPNKLSNNSSNLDPNTELDLASGTQKDNSVVTGRDPVRGKTLHIVESGDILMIRHPETTGIDGKDIYGNIVSAYQGQRIEFSAMLAGTSLIENNPNILVASICGQATWVNNSITVLPVASIESVDISTGHITFEGSIDISGNVAAGMKVQASGDIFIEGRVEQGAQIEATGDIILRQGAFGKGAGDVVTETVDSASLNPSDDEQQATPCASVQLRSRSNIYALSLQNTLIRTEKSLIVTKSIIQCEVDAGKHVLVGSAHSSASTIDGGTIKAKYSIFANILGSPDALLTRLQVGDNQSLLAQATLLDSEINGSYSKRAELEKALAQCMLSHANDGSAKKNKTATLHYLNNEILELSNMIMLYRVEQEKCLIESQALQHARISGGEKINPNLRIKIANHSQTIRNNLPAGSFILHKNNIDFVSD